METLHPEEDSPPSTRGSHEQYAECPIDGCGELVSLTEMDYHIDLHVEEQQDTSDSFGEQVANIAESSISSSWPVGSQSTIQDIPSRQQGDATQPREQLPSTQLAGSFGTKSVNKGGDMQLGVGGHPLSTPMTKEPDTRRKQSWESTHTSNRCHRGWSPYSTEAARL